MTPYQHCLAFHISEKQPWKKYRRRRLSHQGHDSLAWKRCISKCHRNYALYIYICSECKYIYTHMHSIPNVCLYVYIYIHMCIYDYIRI